MAKLRGQMEGVEALDVEHVRVGAVAQQHGDRVEQPLAHRPLQRRGHQLAANRIHLRAVVQQIPAGAVLN